MPIHDVDAPGDPLAACAAHSLERLRRDAPLIHCLTNTVAQTLTANLLLAAGAVPAMSMALDEIDQLVAQSGALLVNLGTLDEARRAAMSRAIAVAARHHKPWVLDPVMVDRAPARLEFARALLVERPAVVRANAAEIGALAGGADPAAFAKAAATVVAQTGAVDVVCDATSMIEVRSGHPLMARVTGLGCAASALMAAFCAVERNPLRAAAHSLLVLGTAAERAADSAAGPGSFHSALLDQLYTLDAHALMTRDMSP